ncbi:MAG: tetratricopeptide repeat protein [Candidatus Korobacteraceae bacterium]
MVDKQRQPLQARLGPDRVPKLIVGRFSSPNALALVFAALLVLATAAVYVPATGYSFCDFDDGVYVTANSHVQSGLTWETVKWAFSTYDAANWHPITWLSHSLDYQFFRLDPSGHHGVNVVLHIVNVLLLFWVLLRATGFVGRSAMVAALFAVHPINVESVAWVAERKNLLSMLFFLLALAAYRWYAQQPRIARYSLCAFLFVLGLMSKPQVITLPFVLLLWDYWPLQRMFPATAESSSPTAKPAIIPAATLSWLVLEKLPLLALSAASAVITVEAQRAGGAIATFRIPLDMRLANAAISYVRYLEKAFWPSRLALFYPHPLRAALGWQAVAGAVLLLGITVRVALARRHRYLLVGWLWFLGTLVPMIGLVQVGAQAMADRYAYLPFVGLSVMICWGAAELAQQWHIPAAVLPVIGLAVLTALILGANRQIAYWKDDVTLWSHTVKVTNRNFVAEDNLGEALVAEGRMEEAMPHFFRAAAIFPPDPTSNLNIGAYEQVHQDFSSAIAQYKLVLNNTNNPAVRRRALMNMADAYNALGESARAQQCLEAAARLHE